MEKFLYAMAQVISGRFQVVSGVYDVVTVLDSDNEYYKTLNLHFKEEKIPIPKIIYKVVSYKLPDCNNEVEFCWFETVIVIHNDPKFTEKDRLCKEDKCEKWGFGSIQYIDEAKTKKSERIYYCRLVESLAEMLKVKFSEENGEELDLKWLPYYDEHSGEMLYKFVQGEIEEKVKQLFGNK